MLAVDGLQMLAVDGLQECWSAGLMVMASQRLMDEDQLMLS